MKYRLRYGRPTDTTNATATTCTYVVLLSHFTRAPEAGRTRPEESLNALLHQGAQGDEFNDLSGRFPFAVNRAIMIVFSMSTFWVCGVFNQCNVADYNWLDVSGNLTSQNIAIRLAAMIKKAIWHLQLIAMLIILARAARRMSSCGSGSNPGISINFAMPKECWVKWSCN